MIPTTDQVSGMADRTISGALIALLGFILHKMALAGIIAESDVTLLSPMLIILLMAAWGYWINRPKAIVQAAAALPGTTVVTTPDLASATPDQPNIIPNTKTQTIARTEVKP